MSVQTAADRLQELPAPGVHVIVQCDGYRCMAYRSHNGKWLSSHSDREVTGVIKFYPLHQAPVKNFLVGR